ncbi:MAG: tannase/feruloyl esterase family alpha/beta hydrolase [Rubrivivax sp.]|jgi:predicted esterase
MHQPSFASLIAVTGFLLVGCSSTGQHALTPQLSPAQPARLLQCESLAGFSYANTSITAARTVASGALSNGGQPVGEHCQVTGQMNRRTSPVDGQAYAIGFEMRLPRDWSGRFLYQGNGGTDGVVVTADGGALMGSGGILRHGLQQGFAVISSDAGHTSAQNPLFGLDPQARLDYGYQAVGTLTPMAKALIRAAYGKGPDRSYIGGTSNGGRHALVAASRYAVEYDGILANAPGIHLPKASVSNLSHVKRWSSVATTQVVNGLPDLESALPAVERRLIANAILSRCDALDGLVDGLVQDAEACRSAFDLQRDVPTCTGPRDGSCLSSAQKSVVAAAFAPVRRANGEAFYPGFPFDPGIVQPGWAEWKFRNSVRTARNPVSVGFIFSTPPSSDLAKARDPMRALAFAQSFDIELEAPKIFATNSTYTESGMSFMTPPQANRLNALRERGGKVIVVHGTADPIFSIDDTVAWYKALDAHHRGRADGFARFFPVPGMGHSRGGPATEQFDALGALVEWVEYGRAPDRILASVRGPGNPGGANPDVPTTWSATRTRPLCPYPLVARYKGGDSEAAASFACER